MAAADGAASGAYADDGAAALNREGVPAAHADAAAVSSSCLCSSSVSSATMSFHLFCRLLNWNLMGERFLPGRCLSLLAGGFVATAEGTYSGLSNLSWGSGSSLDQRMSLDQSRSHRSQGMSLNLFGNIVVLVMGHTLSDQRGRSRGCAPVPKFLQLESWPVMKEICAACRTHTLQLGRSNLPAAATINCSAHPLASAS